MDLPSFHPPSFASRWILHRVTLFVSLFLLCANLESVILSMTLCQLSHIWNLQLVFFKSFQNCFNYDNISTQNNKHHFLFNLCCVALQCIYFCFSQFSNRFHFVFYTSLLQKNSCNQFPQCLHFKWHVIEVLISFFTKFS